jgi:hypothetical protein
LGLYWLKLFLWFTYGNIVYYGYVFNVFMVVNVTMVFMVILLVFVILVAIKDIQGLMKNES